MMLMTLQMNKQFILHLSLIDGVGPATIRTIMQSIKLDMKTPDFYSFTSQDWMYICGLNQRIAEKITTELRDTNRLELELQRIEKNNSKWAVITDPEYPALLREIYTPPAVLYWMGGDFDDVCKNALAVVGSRKINMYGQRVIGHLIPDLVMHGWTIVSGGAIGVDTVAHQKTIAAGGKTIVVLGSGLLNLYPPSNYALFDAVVESGGIVVSPFSLTEQPLQGNFPARNRIISGLSRGCLVVQAARKSGALITAQYALEQGREVFAIPGSIEDELSSGCHSLIQNGAKLVVTVADILSEFGEYVVQPVRSESVPVDNCFKQNQEIDSSITPAQRKIILACRVAVSCDEIVQATDLSLSEVQIELFDLQITGKVTQDFSGMWIATGL